MIRHFPLTYTPDASIFSMVTVVSANVIGSTVIESLLRSNTIDVVQPYAAISLAKSGSGEGNGSCKTDRYFSGKISIKLDN